MTTEERLARVEENVIHIRETLSVLVDLIKTDTKPAIADHDKRLYAVEAENKVFKVVLGVLAVGGVGGGGSFLINLLTGGGG